MNKPEPPPMRIEKRGVPLSVLIPAAIVTFIGVVELLFYTWWTNQP